jgi:hypothetical protein
MEIKDILKDYLITNGVKEGKVKLVSILSEIEKELIKDGVVYEGEELELKILSLIDAKLGESEDLFELHDPVKVKTLGDWDRFLTLDRVYQVYEIKEDCIIIRDDSGDFNPYLKDRFINLSKRMQKSTLK